jgi:predicted ribosome quality control (RQC) complex YloA/Tae2 family protein
MNNLLLLISHASKATNFFSDALVKAEVQSRIEIIRLCFISSDYKKKKKKKKEKKKKEKIEFQKFWKYFSICF